MLHDVHQEAAKRIESAGETRSTNARHGGEERSESEPRKTGIRRPSRSLQESKMSAEPTHGKYIEVRNVRSANPQLGFT